MAASSGVLVSKTDILPATLATEAPTHPPVLFHTYLLAASSLLAWLFSTGNLQSAPKWFMLNHEVHFNSALELLRLLLSPKY